MARQKAKQTNTLLVRTTVGKAKPSCYDLPDESHVYGKRQEEKPQNVSSKGQQKFDNVETGQKNVLPGVDLGMDYISMNRNATKSNVLTAHDVRIYRQKNPIKLTQVQKQPTFGKVLEMKPKNVPIPEKYMPKPGLRLRGFGPLPSDFDNGFTYGMLSEVCTTVGELLSTKNQQDWSDARQTKSKADAANEKARLLEKHVKITKAKGKPKRQPTILEKNTKELFYLPKFTHEDSKTECWRYAPQDYTGVGKKYKSVPPPPWDVKALEKAAARLQASTVAPGKQSQVAAEPVGEQAPAEEVKTVSFAET